ncbi:hypothetical protein MKL09_27870 [Methylobacterium sp. J-048]|nr:hypothetical protein [Methylobacterium sp. J-048]MCJ2060329.1 hypothetical protein [Methylobacterium sp. J-048]
MALLQAAMTLASTPFQQQRRRHREEECDHFCDGVRMACRGGIGNPDPNTSTYHYSREISRDGRFPNATICSGRTNQFWHSWHPVAFLRQETPKLRYFLLLDRPDGDSHVGDGFVS